jgi:hypothetical protein
MQEEPTRNGNDHEPPKQEIVMDTKLVRVGGRNKLYVSADDCVRVLQTMTEALERVAGSDPGAQAQLDLVREITGEMLSAIAAVDTNGYTE